MNPFFYSNARVALLQREAESWIDTPFFSHGTVKGAGVDCVHLAGLIYVACGVIEAFKPPTYTVDGGNHLGQSILEAYVDRTGRFELAHSASDGLGMVSILNDLRAGDLLVFQMGRVTHHAGVYLGKSGFIHIHKFIKAAVQELQDPTWLTRLKKVYRPIELASEPSPLVPA